LIKAILTTLLKALSTGYILMFFSEHLFWARLRPGDTLSGFALTWIAYSCWPSSSCGPGIYPHPDPMGDLLAGSIFGWLTRGLSPKRFTRTCRCRSPLPAWPGMP